MAHDIYRRAAQELVDGTLGSIRRAELQQHLDQCAECRAFAEDLRRIHEVTESLDRPIPPDRVWLQIAGRLRQEGRVRAVEAPAKPASRRYAWLAAAAAAVLLAAASFFVLRPFVQSGRSAPADTATTRTQPERAGASDNPIASAGEEFRLAEQHLQSGIAKLEEATKADQDSIDPQTAETLKRNLDVIDQAIAESRAGLKAEPQSIVARDSLFAALRRKVSLLQDTITLMNEMRKGNAAGAAQVVDGLNKS